MKRFLLPFLLVGCGASSTASETTPVALIEAPPGIEIPTVTQDAGRDSAMAEDGGEDAGLAPDASFEDAPEEASPEDPGVYAACVAKSCGDRECGAGTMACKGSVPSCGDCPGGPGSIYTCGDNGHVGQCGYTCFDDPSWCSMWNNQNPSRPVPVAHGYKVACNLGTVGKGPGCIAINGDSYVCCP